MNDQNKVATTLKANFYFPSRPGRSWLLVMRNCHRSTCLPVRLPERCVAGFRKRRRDEREITSLITSVSNHRLSWGPSDECTAVRLLPEFLGHQDPGFQGTACLCLYRSEEMRFHLNFIAAAPQTDFTSWNFPSGGCPSFDLLSHWSWAGWCD